MPVAEILARNPPTIAECWEMHRHKARVWKPKPPPPPPKPKQPAEPQLVWTGEGWAQVAPAVVPVPQPSGGAVWLYRWVLAWGLLHTTLLAAILLSSWILSSLPRTLVVAGLVWLVFFVIW
jgi:hypothetical protein